MSPSGRAMPGPAMVSAWVISAAILPTSRAVSIAEVGTGTSPAAMQPR